ncbi:dolichol-P-glucose synthetase [Pseudoxanthomonas jiangsuensis]|nr:dolichol-P-glucose synthetase [Pseudoxanthomonas jiangsuensis]
MELTILMPCLNEAETVATCVRKAVGFLRAHGVSGEVIVADNGSTDGSQQFAIEAGARVVPVAARGYGAALQGGIAAARSRFVVMGDADDSYDFSALEDMLDKLRAGNDLVMGNRFAGGIEKGAMPFLHRWLGNPVLSFIGRLFYRNRISDFHCGLRGFRLEAMRDLRLNSDGMEFASEMVVKSALNGLSIAEVPVRLYPDGRSRPPHLRTWRDGWRHLRFLLLHSPRWLFVVPGLALLGVGGLLMATVGLQPVFILGKGLDIHTLAYAGSMVVLGVQMLMFGTLVTALGVRAGWLPPEQAGLGWLRGIRLEHGLVVATGLFLVGLAAAGYAVHLWAEVGYSALDPRVTMRWVVPSVTCMAIGGELALGAFFLEVLRVPWVGDRGAIHG